MSEITDADRANVRAFLTGVGVPLGSLHHDPKREAELIDLLAIYGTSLAKLERRWERERALMQASKVAEQIAVDHEGHREANTGLADWHHKGCAQGARDAATAIYALATEGEGK